MSETQWLAMHEAEQYLEETFTDEIGFVAVARSQWLCVNCKKWKLAGVCVCLSDVTDWSDPDTDKLSCLHCHATEVAGVDVRKPKITKFEPLPLTLKSVVDSEALERFMKTVPKVDNPVRSR